jgi:hypothetical protein
LNERRIPTAEYGNWRHGAREAHSQRLFRPFIGFVFLVERLDLASTLAITVAALTHLARDS